MNKIYHKVENNEIVEYNKTLPFSIERVVDGNKVTTVIGSNTPVEEMVSYGYYPEVSLLPTIGENQRIDGVSYQVGLGEVQKVYSIYTLTEDEIFKATVPIVISPRQARLALYGAGLLDDVEAAVATSKEYQIFWEYSLEIKRDDTILNTMAAALGMTERQVDDLFIVAGKL